MFLAYLALYRKYRPSNFNDLVGQNEIVTVIKNEILNDRLSHAYLFSGPRGTGKTSSAKIIARMINCQNLSSDGIPCGICKSCKNFDNSSDIVEIDAASNNGVDEIRNLRDKVNLVPSYGKYKVYIIDEVHMLTTQAFNALLKTLEEPPAHVIFILATTEFFKIPNTVVSRCQKFQFLKFSIEDICSRLKFISSKEKIVVNDEVLYEISRLSDGGLRDAINMLDQLASFNDKEITLDDVYKLNGVASYLDFFNLLTYVLNNDFTSMIVFFDELDQTGKNFVRFIEDLISFLSSILNFSVTSIFDSNIVERNDIVKKLSLLYSEDILYDLILFLNDLLLKMKMSSCQKILLITEFIRFSRSNFSKNAQIQTSKIEKNNVGSKAEENVLVSKLSKENIERMKKIRVNNAFFSASKVRKEEFLNIWDKIKNFSIENSRYGFIAGFLNDVDIMVVGMSDVIFKVKYSSLLDRLFENINLIEELIYEISKTNYKIFFLSEEEWNLEKKTYINNLKSGYKYNYIKENNDVDFLNKIKEVQFEDNDLEKIVSILGNSIISYE